MHTAFYGSPQASAYIRLAWQIISSCLGHPKGRLSMRSFGIDGHPLVTCVGDPVTSSKQSPLYADSLPLGLPLKLKQKKMAYSLSIVSH